MSDEKSHRIARPANSSFSSSSRAWRGFDWPPTLPEFKVDIPSREGSRDVSFVWRHLRPSVAMRITSPQSGDVLEQGAEVTLSASFGPEHAGEAFHVSIADGRSWSGRWWRSVAENVRAAPDGFVSVRYRVPRDLVASDNYVVKFAAADAKPPREVEVAGVKVSTPLKIKRLGRDEVVVEWSPSALPTEASARDGWRLAVDVTPTVHEGETTGMVVGDLFLQAASEGLTVHTRRASILFDVSKEDAAARRKRLRLTVDRSYRIALAGFTVGELEAVFSTSRVTCRMSVVQLRAVGGGHATPQGGARRVVLGHADRRRAAPGKTDDAKRDKDRTIEPVRASSALEGDDPPLPPSSSPDVDVLGPSFDAEKEASREASREASDEPPTPGSWEVDARGAGTFGADRGVNVTVIRASDLSVAHDETWDLSGGRRAADAAAAADSLRRAFADGHLRRGSPRRARWGSHFVAVTTAGAWFASPGKDGDDRGAAAALDFVVERLGGDAATRAVVRDACARAPGQQSGIAILAACGPGGVRSRAWAGAGGSAKARGAVALALARCVDACEWFPALVRVRTGPHSDADSDAHSPWRSPWTSWGGEPWFGVPEWSAEETRVSRHASTLRDFRAAFLGKPDAFAGAGDVAEEDDDASSGARVDVHATAKTLLAYVSAKYTAARWCPARRLRDAYRTLTDEELGLVDAAETLVVESASTGRARAAAELVAAGAVTHLARRVRSLLTPEGDLAAETSAESESAEDRTEARALSQALATLMIRNGAALLAEATRGGVAVDAVVRAFLAGWKGNLGTRPAPEVEACVEELANADLANAEVRIFAPRESDGIGVDVREGDIAAADDDERASPSTTTTTSAPPTSIVSALRAKLTYLPAATRATTSARGIAIVLEIDPPDPKRPFASIPLPNPRAPQKASSTPMDVADENDELDDVEPWGGSDAGSDEVMIIDERAEPRLPSPAATNAARRLMREDPMAQGGGDVGSNDATNALESSTESVRGGVAVFLAKDGDWSAHEAMVKQAPRLAHLAQSRGAVGALFLWPDGAPGRPPVQPLLANPNYDIALGIPVATLPARDFDAVLSSSAAGWIVSIAPAGEGSTTTVARRCGDALAEACAFRPGAGAAGASARASAGAGRVAGLAKMRAKAAAARREEAAAAEEEEERAKAKAKTTGKGGSTAGGDGASAKGDGGDGWSWSKYLGLGGGGAKEGEDVVTTGSAEANGDAMDVEEKVEGEVRNEADANDVDLAAEGREPDLEPEPEPFDAFESARARRWSAAMRIAYALGDAGKEILWRAYPSPPEGAGAVRVLCLDGGGIRGLATIVMLERVMRAAGAWCVGECFDLIVGTSTGGVIALGAGLLRLTLKEVGELYDEMASEVFKPDGYYEFFRRGPGHAAARSFERVMGDMLGPEANQPLYAAAAHPRWYAAGCETRGEGSGCRAGGPPRVCLVSSLVSRNPATPFLLRSYRRRAAGDGTAHVGELPGEHRLGAVHALRATTAAPWYMEELTLQKELGLGRVTRRSDDAANAAATSPSEEDTDESDVERGAIPAERASRGTMEPADASRAEATLRCIDGAMACNNPTAVGIFEARRLFSRDRPLVVVSLGTGAGTPCEMETDSRDVGNIMNNIRNATCDVLQVAATVRHVLGEEDQYFRFQPTDEIFSCDLAESKEETRSELRAAAARYMNTDATVAEVAKLAALLRR